jgi:hypothetical protein
MGWISREPFFHHSDSTQNNLNGAAGELTNTPFTGIPIPVGDRFTLSAANGGITSIAAVEIRAENLFGLAVSGPPPSPAAKRPRRPGPLGGLSKTQAAAFN